MPAHKHRVIAFGMHETEIASARAMMQNPEVTQSFVVGEIGENEIEALEKEGLIVQVIERGVGRDLASSAMERVAVKNPLSMVMARTATGFLTDEAAKTNLPQGAVDYVVVSTRGPLLEPAKYRLDQLAATVVEALPGSQIIWCIAPLDFIGIFLKRPMSGYTGKIKQGMQIKFAPEQFI